jgi:alpha-glucuronidase
MSFEILSLLTREDYILQISGIAMAIVKAGEFRSRYEIVLGQNERLDELKTGINLNMLKEDGFVIRTDSLRLIIAGGNEKGTLYGVYTSWRNSVVHSCNTRLFQTQHQLKYRNNHSTKQ